MTSGFKLLELPFYARLSVRPTGDRGLLCFASGSLNVSKSRPFFSRTIALASVFENYALYGSYANLLSEVKLVFYAGKRNYSNKLELCFGLNVLPRPYFSPEGDLGGVRPFYVGDPGCFYIFVIKRGDGGAVKATPGCFEWMSVSSFEISYSVVDWEIHFTNSWSICPFAT